MMSFMIISRLLRFPLSPLLKVPNMYVYACNTVKAPNKGHNYINAMHVH